MIRNFITCIICLTFLMLSGCSTVSHKSAGFKPAVFNAKGEVVQSEDAQTQGLGEDNQLIDIANKNNIKDVNNVVGRDVGPSSGLLSVRSFYFAFNSDVVAKKYIPAIKAHANYLIAHPSAHILIDGNADIRGSREYNIALGQKRADALASFLRMNGVPARQLRTLSYGAERPIALGNTEAAYRLNRRDDIVYEAV